MAPRPQAIERTNPAPTISRVLPHRPIRRLPNGQPTGASGQQRWDHWPPPLEFRFHSAMDVVMRPCWRGSHRIVAQCGCGQHVSAYSCANGLQLRRRDGGDLMSINRPIFSKPSAFFSATPTRTLQPIANGWQRFCKGPAVAIPIALAFQHRDHPLRRHLPMPAPRIRPR